MLPDKVSLKAYSSSPGLWGLVTMGNMADKLIKSSSKSLSLFMTLLDGISNILKNKSYGEKKTQKFT